MSNEFTRSYVGGDGASLKDSAYQLTKCVIVPREHSKHAPSPPADIRRMIGVIRIHESLFNPSLFFEIGIRDDYNFFEEFGLSGDEIVFLEFETKTVGNATRVHKYEVHVTKINDYARGDSQVHAYTLIGVSAHAFYAPLHPVNTLCKGITTKSIKLLCKGLDVDVIEKSVGEYGGCITQTHTVFGMKNPLKAALELLSVSVDNHGTPYFLYQTLSNAVYLTPLSWINDTTENPVYRTFTYTDQLSSDPNSKLEYFERSSQITKLASNIGTSPVEQLVKGAGPKKVYELNLNTKTADSTFQDTLLNLATKLASAVGANITKYRYNQPDANGNDARNSSIATLKARHEAHVQGQIAAYDAFSHQFSVMGDMLLNPGRVVHLQFPKTLDPITNPEKGRERFDNRLTKDYLVFQAVHTFQEGKHTTDIIAKTDKVKV